MKRILVIGSIFGPDMRKDLEYLKENIDLDKYSLMSPIMFAPKGDNNETVHMIMATTQKTIITEPNKIQIVLGPQRKNEKFDEIYVINENALFAQLEFLNTLSVSKFFKISDYYTNQDSKETFDNIQKFVEFLNKEIENDKRIQ